MIKAISAILAMLQWFGITIGILPYEKNVDYGGSVSVCQAAGAPIYLTENGKSDYVIILPDSAEEAEQTAAKELSDYIAKISSAVLPIRTDASLPSEKEIVLGKTNRETDASISRDGLGTDGFVMKAVENKIFIAGGSARGTLYGAYTFLEEQLGCRWYTADFSYIPQNSDLAVGSLLNDRQVPSFQLRRNASAGSTAKYAAQMKMNVAYWDSDETYGGALTYIRALSPNKLMWDVTFPSMVPDSLFDAHPEYFALRDDTGKRTNQHVCLTNPDVFELCAEYAENCIRANNTTARHIHLGQKDNQDYCQCENCKAMYEKYGSVSAATLVFANKLQQRLVDDGFSDIYVTFFAYLETAAPPTKGDLHCLDRVVPVICGSHAACKVHPYTECGHNRDADNHNMISRFSEPNSNAFVSGLKGWIAAADETYIYEYTINFLNSPQLLANFATLQPDVKWMQESGVTGITYVCGDGHYAAFNELRNYLLCKLQWNTDADVSYYMQDFMTHYYGEKGGEYLREYLDLMTAKTAATSHQYDFGWQYEIARFNPLETAKADCLWKKALAQKNISEQQLYNIQKEEVAWRFYKSNLFLGEFSFLNPLRAKRNSELYDDMVKYSIEISSLASLKAKDKINLYGCPADWR